MLEIYLFGRVRVCHSPNPNETLLTGTLADLFTFLVFHRHRFVERDTLIDLFWRDEDPKHAHRCLSTALWRLRLILEPLPVPRGTFLICPSTCEVGFDGAGEFCLDTLTFEARARPSLNKPPRDLLLADVQGLEEAMSIYRADLAEQCQHPWVLSERERLRNLYLRCQEHLMSFYASRDQHDRSVEYGQGILEIDPFREEVHQQVIRSYLEMGQRSLAVRQYSRCRQALVTYLDSEPMAETEALITRVSSLHGATKSIHAKGCQPANDINDTELETVYEQLSSARQSLREVEQKVEEAARLVDILRHHRSTAQVSTALSRDKQVTPS